MNARDPHAKLNVGDLVLRCYAERDRDGTWFAICLPLNLYARGDSYEQARMKLHHLVRDYIKDALTVESEHIGDLVPRRAPAYFYLRYALIWCCVHFRRGVESVHKFKEYLPLIPAV